ncbi:TPA: hypothetical protein ACRMDH_003937 [Pseudomonas aeruginosa]
MRKLHSIFFAVPALLCAHAQADSYPQFAQYQTPDVIACQSANGTLYGYPAVLCTDASRPEKHVVRYQNNATGEITMQEEDTYDLLRCDVRLGKCTDRSKNYRGKVTATKDSYYIAFKDFYVHPGTDGKEYAYRTGTGPLFGGTAASSQSKPPSNDVAFDIWCNPQGDYCDYQNQQLTRAQLPQFIPVAKNTSDCMLEFCYNAKTEVIGLNPDYSFK